MLLLWTSPAEGFLRAGNDAWNDASYADGYGNGISILARPRNVSAIPVSIASGGHSVMMGCCLDLEGTWLLEATEHSQGFACKFVGVRHALPVLLEYGRRFPASPALESRRVSSKHIWNRSVIAWIISCPLVHVSCIVGFWNTKT